jgi:hypothetical protein
VSTTVQGVISIEASDPVPYVASQPDPRTFVVEMRDVVAAGFADNFKVDPRVPVAAVHVENGRAFDGSSVARVSLDLAQPIRPARPQLTQRHLCRGGSPGSRGRRSHQRRRAFECHPRSPGGTPRRVHRNHAPGDRDVW